MSVNDVHAQQLAREIRNRITALLDIKNTIYYQTIKTHLRYIARVNRLPVCTFALLGPTKKYELILMPF